MKSRKGVSQNGRHDLLRLSQKTTGVFLTMPHYWTLSTLFAAMKQLTASSITLSRTWTLKMMLIPSPSANRTCTSKEGSMGKSNLIFYPFTPANRVSCSASSGRRRRSMWKNHEVSSRSRKKRHILPIRNELVILYALSVSLTSQLMYHSFIFSLIDLIVSLEYYVYVVRHFGFVSHESGYHERKFYSSSA